MSDENMKDETEKKNEIEENDEIVMDDVKEDEISIDEPERDEESKLNDLFTNNKTAMSLALGLTGVALFLVLVVGLFSGVTFATILWRMFVSVIFFFVFGFGLGALIKYFIPGIAQLIEGSNLDTEEPLGENVDLMTGGMDDSAYTETFHMGDGEDKSEGMSSNRSVESQFNIPNDPELMAKAVKTILHKDD
ncbi:MAG: hypothetical protein IEMM0008_1397 [bacterium]|nr:MAG: hypothetical protein IEMM0008_1397 [bacterium]